MSTINENSDDKKDIEIEEREKMLNAENKAPKKDVESPNTEEKQVTANKEIKEGMEVKPKKIPIGGIQMPGFFTRSKSKERCKEEGDNAVADGAELIDKKVENKDEHSVAPKLKLPNPFRKSKVEEDGDKSEAKEKKNILDTIKLPLVSVFPRKKKDSDNLENQTQAGLASMETLDEKSTDDKGNKELKNVSLDKKDSERQNPEEMPTWMDKLKTYKVAIIALLIFLFLMVIIVIIALSGRQQLNLVRVVRDGKYIKTITSCGEVEGLSEDSAFAFRGIPYARPPLGDLRFRHAQPLNSLNYCWNGTFIAHNATDLCLQMLSNGTVTGSEDCLTLDVVTPYVRYDNPLPVIVLIGAESLMGGSPGKMRPSARYARSRDVVFVRPNFRLGALGFLALKTLSESDYPHSSGNYGLSDILEALNWVQLNIEHFGGDKDSVTLFGHRAGGTLVTALSTLPNAKKYFSRAWASSGGAEYPRKALNESELDNNSYLNDVQCQNAECLRRADAEKLVRGVQDTWMKTQPDLPDSKEDSVKRHQWLVLDGKILREDPSKVWSRSEERSVKLVLGSTAHVGSSDKLLLRHTTWTEDLVKQHIKSSVLGAKNLTETVLQMYPATYKGLSAIISDIRTVCPLFVIATQIRQVSFYVVTQTRFKQNLADVDSDIDAILGRYEPKTPEQRRYFSAIQSLFYHYVWHGTIEHGRIGQKVLIVGQDVLPNATYSHCSYWIDKNIVPKYAALD